MSKNLFPKSFLLLIIIILQSCVSAKITSNKDANYTRQPKRIYLMMNGSKKANDFCVGFVRGFQNKLEEKGVKTSLYISDSLSLLDNDDINKKIDEFSPEAVMIISQKEVHSTNNMVDGGNFELTLVDRNTKKNVWKGEFDVYGQYGMTDAIDKSISELMKKLTEDKII
ncbi:hypothetical protein [Mucilaginibacter xinganensis]|uniref:Lipoprotein n=1 Tax=Mucilaginibacter xinganensis TaxID=1234841 RepID=A0A223NYY4_9SPHI|nr:hypothetical protein [Mucilaginibacter xinganensis]ASU34980.1 hypothetical protein MuYL_3095 [Mucilaginibacter xinganensis]